MTHHWLRLGDADEPTEGPWINLAHVSAVDTRLSSNERGYVVSLGVNGDLYSWGHDLGMSETDALVVASALRTIIAGGTPSLVAAPAVETAFTEALS